MLFTSQVRVADEAPSIVTPHTRFGFCLQAGGDRRQRGRDRVGGRAQTLTHDQRGQVALGFGKRPQKRPLQVGVDLLIQFNLSPTGIERNRQRHAGGETNVLIRITPQRALSDLGDSLSQIIITHTTWVFHVAFFERIQGTEIVRVENADETVEFFEPVLQGCGGEHDGLGRGTADTCHVRGDLGLPGPVGAQPVGLIAHHQIPMPRQGQMLGIGELIGANQHLLGSIGGDQFLQVAAFKQ